MKHAEFSSAWRPVRAHRGGDRRPEGVLTAFAFNLCLLLLPLAAAASLILIARDQLYAYEYSDAGARAIAQRVAKLNGELIQLDFDRQHQWNDLVDLELRSNDLNAARGFLLSGAGMLPRRAAQILNQSDATDAELEIAALQLLTPSTRARYVAAGPLLSDRPREANPVAAPTPPIGAPEDFELLARAVLAEPETDPLQFILTGYSLGLTGDLSPRMAAGAAALLDATRREQYQASLAEEVTLAFTASVPIERFRAAALEGGEGGANFYANAATAFRAALVPARVAETRALLEDIGEISEATSRSAAANLLTHATKLRDLPRLMLLAQAAGDRAAAAAKRLPRDGRLLTAARGQLTMTRELAFAFGVAAFAALGLVLMVAMKLAQGALGAWRRWEDGDYGGELVEIGGASNWRPL